jgi:hypothetical protein
MLSVSALTLRRKGGGEGGEDGTDWDILDLLLRQVHLVLRLPPVRLQTNSRFLLALGSAENLATQHLLDLCETEFLLQLIINTNISRQSNDTYFGNVNLLHLKITENIRES